MNKITSYHIHLYYTDSTINIARDVANHAENLFSLEVGRFHERPVGPHPMWSVQLLVPVEKWGEVLTWIKENRKDLIVFAHPNTGDDLADHTTHAIWLGKELDLVLSLFS